MKSLRNTTASPVIISDTGVTVAASSTYVVVPQDYPLWSMSTEVDTYVTNGTIVVNDGYDDLKPNTGLLHLHEESVPRSSAFNAAASIQATSASTNTLTSASKLLWIYTGTTIGQIIKLPNATTINKGHRFEFWMKDIATAAIKYSDNSAFANTTAEGRTTVTLVDNSTANGVWVVESNFTGTGDGVDLDTRQFGRQGVISNNTVLLTINNVLGDTSPDCCAYNFYFRRLSWSNSNNAGQFNIRVWKYTDLTLTTKVIVHDHLDSGRANYMNADENIPINKGESFYVEITSVGSPRPADINVIVSLRQR